MLPKFGVDIQNQTKVRVWKPKNPIWPAGGHFENDWKSKDFYPHTQVLCYWTLELILKAKLKLRVWNKKKNPIWPIGVHFESDITENQQASVYGHSHLAYKIWNWNSKGNLTYAPETMSPRDGRTDGRTDKQTDGQGDGDSSITPPPTSLGRGVIKHSANSIMNELQFVCVNHDEVGSNLIWWKLLNTDPKVGGKVAKIPLGVYGWNAVMIFLASCKMYGELVWGKNMLTSDNLGACMANPPLCRISWLMHWGHQWWVKRNVGYEKEDTLWNNVSWIKQWDDAKRKLWLMSILYGHWLVQ